MSGTGREPKLYILVPDLPLQKSRENKVDGRKYKLFEIFSLMEPKLTP